MLALCQVVTDTMFAELKECFMEAFDDNKDDKIEIREVSAPCSARNRHRKQSLWTMRSK